MDLRGLNAAQRTVVTTLPGPLFVAAGAGSGKTFTLKLRTANALLPNDSGFQLDSIEEVLAITYTEKAAAELLSRIKDTLVSEGLEGEALLADSAWISTIHGMAQRILHENALEIGIDPEFEVITELLQQDLKAQARESVIQKVHSGQIDLSRVDWRWQLLSSGQYSTGLIDDAAALADRMKALPRSFKAYRPLGPAFTPQQMIERMVVLGEEFLSYPSQWEKPPHKGHEQPKFEAMEVLLPEARAWLEGPQAKLSFDTAEFDREAFLDLFEAFPIPTPTFADGKPGEGFYRAYVREYATLRLEVYGIYGQFAAQAAYDIASAIEDEYTALKSQRNVIDSDDMLKLCLRALEEHPDIATRYRERFKLIMVDEFQDTDKVQIQILRHLAAPGFANVCVVGDAQQSIYRFRGADVDAFVEYREELRGIAPEPDDDDLLPELAENYRSHRDILAFVDRIFSQEQSFGDAYLPLTPKGKVNDEPDPVMDAQPRIEVDVIHYDGSDLKERALAESAERIATYFAKIKDRYAAAYPDDAGRRRQSMALLLGVTTDASVYIEALRRHGLEAMMTSGSVLTRSVEAKTVNALVRYALNTNDEQPLLDILTSGLFAITDDDLLLASHYVEDGAWVHGRFAKGFKQAHGSQGLAGAQEALTRFVHRARRGSASDAIRSLLVESGDVERSQARGVEGLARIGNFSKTLLLLEGVEARSTGIASTVRAFEATLAGANESPGVLSVADADFVEIMTIHGSKGLQFDHVAVADFKTGDLSSNTDFFAENAAGRTYAISKKKLSLGKPLKDALLIEEGEATVALADVKTPGQLRQALEETARSQTAAEARRLLYVGLTRAVRSLHLSFRTKSDPEPSKGLPYGGDGIFRDVHQALGWDTTASRFDDSRSYGYGGTSPARVMFLHLEGSADSSEDREGEEAPKLERAPEGETTEPFIVPIRDPLPQPALVPYAPLRRDVHSYTSLSSGSHGNGSDPSSVFEEADERLLEREVGEDPTALGNAFHHLAQLAILERAKNGGGALVRPSEEHIRAQMERYGLNEAQRARLCDALENWFESATSQELASFQTVEAEVPFMVALEGSQGPFYLEGEIDALAFDDKEGAFFVDYKTGGSEAESPTNLADKHRLQASCYAFALLRSGFKNVRGVFVRVEHSTEVLPSDVPSRDIQTVVYEFTDADLQALESLVISREKDAS